MKFQQIFIGSLILFAITIVACTSTPDFKVGDCFVTTGLQEMDKQNFIVTKIDSNNQNMFWYKDSVYQLGKWVDGTKTGNFMQGDSRLHKITCSNSCTEVYTGKIGTYPNICDGTDADYNAGKICSSLGYNNLNGLAMCKFDSSQSADVYCKTKCAVTP